MKSLFILTMAASAAWAQSNGSLRARELFYTPPPAAKPAQVSASKPAASVATAPKKSSPAATANSGGSGPAVTAVAPTRPKASDPVTAQVETPSVAVSQPAIPTRLVSSRPAEAIPLGMRYAVLRRSASGRFVEVDPESTFHSGDRIRLEVQANSTGFLYVVAQGSSGNWQVLFPSREVAGGSNEIRRGEVRQVPSGDRGQFVFDEQAGTESLFFVFTRQPEESLDKLIYSVRQPSAAPSPAEPPRVMMASASIGNDVISRLRGQMQARDLVFEKVENDEAPASPASEGLRPTSAPDEVKFQTASYVVNPSTAPDARVVVDVKLIHK
jgi:Domain of unknown function (DUF4384)